VRTVSDRAIRARSPLSPLKNADMDQTKCPSLFPAARIVARTVTIMLGGTSAEREVSLRTGVAVARALRGLGHKVLELDPQSSDWSIPEGTDVVFLALHGTYGEDGTVQQRLEELGLPYTGCDPAASRTAFDKVLTKQHCLQARIPTPRFAVIDDPRTPWPRDWKPPVVLKPVCQGSSVGLQFVDRPEDWSAALTEVFRFDSRVLLEEKIDGREATVGILAGQALPVVEIRPKEGSYDYRHKYTAGATEYLAPAPFEPSVTRAIQEAALGAFQAIGGRDYSRVDLMVDTLNTPFVLEINTLPGMTETSLLPKAAAAAGLSYSELCQKMIDLALERATCRAAGS
jgi:D-alanine-D-alanine ligase